MWLSCLECNGQKRLVLFVYQLSKRKYEIFITEEKIFPSFRSHVRYSALYLWKIRVTFKTPTEAYTGADVNRLMRKWIKQSNTNDFIDWMVILGALLFSQIIFCCKTQWLDVLGVFFFPLPQHFLLPVQDSIQMFLDSFSPNYLAITLINVHCSALPYANRSSRTRATWTSGFRMPTQPTPKMALSRGEKKIKGFVSLY